MAIPISTLICLMLCTGCVRNLIIYTTQLYANFWTYNHEFYNWIELAVFCSTGITSFSLCSHEAWIHEESWTVRFQFQECSQLFGLHRELRCLTTRSKFMIKAFCHIALKLQLSGFFKSNQELNHLQEITRRLLLCFSPLYSAMWRKLDGSQNF